MVCNRQSLFQPGPSSWYRYCSMVAYIPIPGGCSLHPVKNKGEVLFGM